MPSRDNRLVILGCSVLLVRSLHTHTHGVGRGWAPAFCLCLCGSHCCHFLLHLVVCFSLPVSVPLTSRPGRTKHFQTLELTEKVVLCDCPGLVFPSFMNSKVGALALVVVLLLAAGAGAGGAAGAGALLVVLVVLCWWSGAGGAGGAGGVGTSTALCCAAAATNPPAI